VQKGIKSMRPNLTHELHISFNDLANDPLKTKSKVIAWLTEIGCDSFVEGVVEGLDLPFEYVDPDRDYFGEMGGEFSKISIYKFDRDYLVDLRAKAEARFGADITCELASMETKIWEEGWKDSFRPFSTRSFRVRPPWITEGEVQGLIPLVIEPGMAFGSGQHATTQICLQLIEDLVTSWPMNVRAHKNVADIGTGSGILAIALAKLGINELIASDIDPDAIQSSGFNSSLNQVKYEVKIGSIPEKKGPFDLVVANILTVVLRELVPSLKGHLKPGAHVILSGILAEEADEMAQVASTLSLTESKRVIRDGWAGLIFVLQD
jgi:ribosomal protein L11 methyltransferase